jgi:signal transduction histidine kinase
MRGAVYHIDRATAITQKLSSFAKPIRERLTQPVSVAAEVGEVLTLVGYDLKLEQIEIRQGIPSDLPLIAVDRRQFQEVLFNLIRNAGQAIHPPGLITIRASHAEGRVRIDIADTGTGIPADRIGKIYDPFFTTKDAGQGTGLGLFIVRQIVEQNEGRILVKSIEGEGTTFSLEFPVAKGAAMAT